MTCGHEVGGTIAFLLGLSGRRGVGCGEGVINIREVVKIGPLFQVAQQGLE